MIFFDGDHAYNGVLQDTVANWLSLRSFEGKPALAVYRDAILNDGLHYINRPNHFKGVNAVCTKLLQEGLAKVRESTGSLVVLQKLDELPNDFGCQ